MKYIIILIMKQINIRIMNQFEEYNIDDLIKEVADTEVKIKLVHLIDLFPKYRSKFLKAFKLANITKESLVNALTLISENKFIKIKGHIENTLGEIFLDSCASVNLITSSALKKFNIQKSPIGTVTEKIYQVYNNNCISSEVYELNITIGN